ncbi:MAG: glycosyltransferase family 1 protein [Calditrichaeota bacterium]|nr:MAG: glycosyltransferase family 1 protein [Calditrichota bacterium]
MTGCSMNILFLNSIGKDVWGGGEKWMLLVGEGLTGRGHKAYYSGREGSLFLRRCEATGFQTLPLTVGSDFSLPTIWKIASSIKEKSISAIIANFNKDVRLAGLAAKISGNPIVVARNGLPILYNNWRYRLTYRWLADGIITNTSAIREKYLSYGWIPEHFVKVIHNGIELQRPESVDKDTLRQEFHLPREERPTVGIFGRLVEQKQHLIFLEVAKNVLKEFPEAIFLVVGDGPLKNDIQEYARELEILDNVYLLGRQDRVLELYGLCDVVLLTSLDEGQPNVVLESMLMGTPVVAFDVGGVADIITSDQNGILVPPNDIYLMSQRVKELLFFPELREMLGVQAEKTIREEFPLQKMIEEVELYLQTLQQMKKGEHHGR